MEKSKIIFSVLRDLVLLPVGIAATLATVIAPELWLLKYLCFGLGTLCILASGIPIIAARVQVAKQQWPKSKSKEDKK